MYAVVSPHRGLTFRSQDLSQMWRDVAGDRASCATFDVQRATRDGDGLVGVVSAHPDRDGQSHEANPIAGPLVAALGGPEGDWFGDLGLCGSTAAPAAAMVPCDLSAPQQHLVRSVYEAVLAGLQSVVPAGD